ncbi:MAG: hypothetical protein IT458_20040 [Planctomycetes bacterium]|nr:hypothetical protein [Planctomycetota bacterium]
MGVFLLFDRSNRLVRMQECSSGDFGALEPHRAFFAPADPRIAEHHALELAPEILLQVRPRTWSLVVGHSTKVDGGVRVDPVEAIRERLRSWRIRALQAEVFELARDLATSRLAAEYLGGELPPHLVERLDHRKADLARAEEGIAKLQQGQLVPVEPELVALAGQLIPL